MFDLYPLFSSSLQKKVDAEDDKVKQAKLQVKMARLVNVSNGLFQYRETNDLLLLIAALNRSSHENKRNWRRRTKSKREHATID